ncbi:MAG: murein biosynthesis integral membrane protein MurJ [Elusimicrobia bacterium]|nr:murein biosynthesis integral membrane protein MurJ [Elusimicrobiota bacterium]
MSINLKIAKAYLILIAASILGHILSLGKEMIVANYFGVTKMLDAFYAALTVPNMIFNIISQPFVVIFIPLYIKYKLTDRDEANHVASIFINYIFILLFLATAITFTFSSEIITFFGFNFPNPETKITATKLLYFLSIIIIFSGLINVFTGLLNSYENFSLPAFSQMFVTISIIVFILFFSKKWGIYVFAWGTIIGLFVQLIFLIPFTKIKGYRHYLDFNWNHPKVKKTAGIVFLFALLAIPGGLNAVINRIMASWLPEGSISALGYADKLVQVPLIIFSGSIATAIFPFLATQFAENKIDDMKNTLTVSIKMTGFVFIPLAVVMMVLARPIIQVLFQRGAFDIAATNLTSKIFIYYCIQLLVTYALVILMRLLLILQDISSIFKVLIIGIVMNIAMNFVFIRLMDPPAVGIALSTSLGCLISTLLYFFFLKKRLGDMHGTLIIKSLTRTAILAFITGVAIFISFGILDSSIGFSLIKQLIKLASSSIIGIGLFVGLAFLFKFEEVEKIYAVAKDKIQNTLKRSGLK